MRTVNIIALVLVIVGALNWGLIGIFDFNLVSYILGSYATLENLVYILVGVSALYVAFYDSDRIFGAKNLDMHS